MATTPSLTINSISNAVITDTGESVSTGKISWSIAGQVNSEFAATKANYFADTSSWSNRYYWSSKSGTASFDGLTNSVTVSGAVSYTEKFIVSTFNKQVAIYATEQEAKTLVDSVPGSASYYYSYGIVQGAYYVYQYDLTVDESTTTYTASKTVDVSEYITVQTTKPKPYYTASRTVTTATASVFNLNVGDYVVLTIMLHANASVIGSAYATASSSSMTLSVDGLTNSTKYSALVTVNGNSLGYIDLDGINPSYSISYTATQVTAMVINLNPGDSIEFGVAEGAGGENKQTITGVAETTSIGLTLVGLRAGMSYNCYVIVNGNTTLGTQNFTTSDAHDFQWDSDIRSGAVMNMYLLHGSYVPAPVTAVEWNRLVDYVNQKLGTSIGHVSPGDEMSLYEGGNVWRVAQALGIQAIPKSDVTAKFFNDLRDQYNSK